jgi:hypothetical protein
MNHLRPLFLFGLLGTIVFFSSTILSANSEDLDITFGSIGFDDLYQSSDLNSDRVEEAGESDFYRSAIHVSLSENFVNNILRKYVTTDGAIKLVNLAFDTSKNAITIQGTVTLEEDVLLANGIPSEFTNLGFKSLLQLEITSAGYLSITFPEDVTAAWFESSSSSNNSNKIEVPTGFLTVAIAQIRTFFSVMSGDFSSFENRKQAILGLIEREKIKAKDLTGYEKEESDLNIQKHQIRLNLVELKQKKARHKQESGNGFMKFVGEADYASDTNFNANKNTILINADLEKMFPFLSDIKLGAIKLIDSDGGRYMKVTLNSLFRK